MKNSRTKAQHIAHHQGSGATLCYPNHPLHGQRVLVMRAENTHGDRHLRVITENGEERLVPEWMFCADAFDADPVEFPLIRLDALRQLIRIVLSSGLCHTERGREGRSNAATQSVSAASRPTKAPTRRRAKRSPQSGERSVGGGDDGRDFEATALRRRTRGKKR